MAMWWLDVARYSDTDGFQSDASRDNWPWRDWVIDAFNANQPFDRFTLEQFAGDLLPGATPEQILATCFHRNHMTNGEGGRDPEESRVHYVLDRVNTMGTAFLGLTLGCCQCHSHKFDPISQAEYYGLYAFFNSILDRATSQLQEVQAARKVDVMVLAERSEPRPTFVLQRGVWDQHAEQVQRGGLSQIAPLEGTALTRLDLAHWLTSRQHPLTARVLVNHLWQLCFGVGLVRTPEDFGITGGTS